MFKSGN